ncbi:MAG: acyl-CoA dehydrogenase, partial [Rhizobacter sp.]|nr:acyl-CoA dehydrogenase [Rhizobacter sp.]
ASAADRSNAAIVMDPDHAFRDEVRAFLCDALTEDLRTAGRRSSGLCTDYEPGIEWHRRLAKKGWSVAHWPIEHGGCGWTPMQHYIFASEQSAADAPQIAPQSTRMVAPVIIAFGTEAQKAKYLPAIRRGDDYWTQGYSEPQAGSDLASLQCRAVRGVDERGDHYRINGSKIWTTHAQYANRIFCLVRTGVGGKAQQGISFLLFDMDLPGITVRPIVSSSGDHELNQVFFDDVRVPADDLLGEENQGWTVSMYLLFHERGYASCPLLRSRLVRLRAALDEAFAGQAADHREHAELRLKLVEAECKVDAVQALELRSLAAQIAGEAPGIRPSVGKILGTETRQWLTELGVEIAGIYAAARLPMDEALLTDLPVPEDAVFSVSAYLNDRAASVYAGSNEVQRNIIAGQLVGR